MSETIGTIAGGIEPCFTLNDYARLVEVFAAQEEQRNMNGGGQMTCNPEFRQLFNDPLFKPVPPESLGVGSGDGRIVQFERSEEALRQKFDELRSKYIDAYRNWMEGAQHDRSKFAHYAKGETALLYMFERCLNIQALNGAPFTTPVPSPFENTSPLTQPVSSPSLHRKRRTCATEEAPPDHDMFFSWLEKIDGYIEEEKLASWPMAMDKAKQILIVQQQNGGPTERIEQALAFIQSKMNCGIDRRK